MEAKSSFSKTDKNTGRGKNATEQCAFHLVEQGVDKRVIAS